MRGHAPKNATASPQRECCVVDQREKNQVSAADTQAQFIARRVLVVDDDPFVCQLLERLLGTEHYEVRTAADGHEALRLILDDAPAFVITDWEMPGMNGLDLCRAIRAHEGIGFIYTIVMTAHSDQDRLVEAFEAGADDFLAKPFNRRELIARLRAGQRIVTLESDLARQRRELVKYNVEMELANRRLAVVNDKLNHMAATDALTGLANRRAAIERMQELFALAQRHAQPFSCILLDIDHFKKFNDTYGHDVGDLVLKDTAGSLLRQARSGEVVSRIGGEEFLILCPASASAQAALGAERHRKHIETAAVSTPAGRLKLTISLGVAEYNPLMKGPDELLKAADDALYAAKRGGRNCVVVSGEEQPVAVAATPEPIARSPAGAPPLAQAPSIDLSMPSVLVVESDPELRSVYHKALETSGVMVRDAESGEQALEQLKNFDPDVALLNADLPDMDGTECARRIRAQPHSANLPMALLTDQTAPAGIIRGFESGIDTYLLKPVRPDELAIRVRALVRWSRSRRHLIHSNEVLAEQTRMLGRLLDFSRLTATVEDLDAILEHTLGTATELAFCRNACVLLPDPTRERLSVSSFVGIDAEDASRLIVPVSQAISGTVFSTRYRRVIADDSELADLADAPDRAFFVNAPGVSIALATPEQVVGVLNLTGRISRAPFEPQVLEFLDLLANVAASAIQDILLRRSRDQARDTIVVALAKLAEHRDDDTGRHLDRVTRYCMALGRELQSRGPYSNQINDAFLSYLERAVPLHDIGKVGVPDAILLKPGKLTPDEMRVMQTHTTIGREVIRAVAEGVPDAGFLAMAEQIAFSHHEWFDGSGYPARISGLEIPLAARIVAVADVYDAITTPRVYKPAMPHERAVAIINEGSGSHFDPTVVDAFIKNVMHFRRLSHELADGVVATEVGRSLIARDRSELATAAGELLHH